VACGEGNESEVFDLAPATVNTLNEWLVVRDGLENTPLFINIIRWFNSIMSAPNNVARSGQLSSPRCVAFCPFLVTNVCSRNSKRLLQHSKRLLEKVQTFTPCHQIVLPLTIASN
jgi:hypothetical protein